MQRRYREGEAETNTKRRTEKEDSGFKKKKGKKLREKEVRRAEKRAKGEGEWTEKRGR